MTQLKRLVIYVEGQTELIFVSALVRHFAHPLVVKISQTKLWGGGSGRITRSVLEKFDNAADLEQEPTHVVSIINSACDSRVVSDIREHYQLQKAKGTGRILGLMDIFPKQLKDVDRFRNGINRALADQVDTQVLLAIVEIEAWFIAQSSHFRKIDDSLTSEKVGEIAGFEPEPSTACTIERPAQTLEAIYKTAGIQYDKSKVAVDRVVEALDLQDLRNCCAPHIDDLMALCNELDSFFSDC